MDANTEISRVAIVGTGLIGGSWAACFLAHGLDVVATGRAPGKEDKVRQYVEAVTCASPHAWRPPIASVRSKGGRTLNVESESALAGGALATVEDRSGVFARRRNTSAFSGSAPLWRNTSSIPVSSSSNAGWKSEMRSRSVALRRASTTRCDSGSLARWTCPRAANGMRIPARAIGCWNPRIQNTHRGILCAPTVSAVHG
jgi:hypothetical protein